MIQEAINKLREQQSRVKERSPQWMVAQQLMDLVRAEPQCAEILAQDLEVEAMSITEAEKKIKAFADSHKTGSFSCVTPVESDRILREFYGLPLDISESVLIPRPDTETLAEAAIDWLAQQDGPRVLDLCAGSGCLGLAIASQVKDARVVLGEISDGALRICRQNIRRNGLTGRVTAMQLDALHPPLQRLGDFDCIVSNPPYIPTGDLPGLDPSVRDYEPHMALDGGADGLDFYRAILRHWPAVLHPGSRLYFEVGIGQADDVLRLMRGVGFGDLEILPDPAGIPRVVLGALYQEI
mgnify:CR=1 FL=1